MQATRGLAYAKDTCRTKQPNAALLQIRKLTPSSVMDTVKDDLPSRACTSLFAPQLQPPLAGGRLAKTAAGGFHAVSDGPGGGSHSCDLAGCATRPHGAPCDSRRHSTGRRCLCSSWRPRISMLASDSTRTCAVAAVAASFTCTHFCVTRHAAVQDERLQLPQHLALEAATPKCHPCTTVAFRVLLVR